MVKDHEKSGKQQSAWEERKKNRDNSGQLINITIVLQYYAATLYPRKRREITLMLLVDRCFNIPFAATSPLLRSPEVAVL